MLPRVRQITLFSVVLTGLFVQSTGSAAEPSRRNRDDEKKSRPIVANPKFDPSAQRLGLFDGMKDGSLETKVVAMDSKHGYVLVSNATDQPITVDLPKAFVATPVLKQFGGGGFGGGGMGGGGFGGGQQGGFGGGQQGGGQQNAGGGFGGGQQGGGGFGGGGQFGGGQQGGGMGQGFFSIPPEKTVKLPYVSACLNHGKAEPTPRSNYTIIPVEEYTQDPVLTELITMVGTGRLASQAAQAAIWSQTDGMSWGQLASKTNRTLQYGNVPYFQARDIQGAQLILATAVGRIRERGESPVAEVQPVRTRGQR